MLKLDVLMPFFVFSLSFFQWLLTITGVIIVIHGGLQAAYIFFVNCLFQGRLGLETQHNEIRRTLGLAIIVGLEFILAGDVIAMISLPDYYNLGMLVILVFIRTILDYFLDKSL